jgi:UDP-N-acetylmuramoylalanine--D-glutamate ligase
MKSLLTRRPRAATALRGWKVAVVGLGRFGGGEGALRFLCAEGAEVTLVDRAEESALAPALAKVRDLTFKARLGRQALADCAEADLVVLNPAVKPDDPLRLALIARGIPVTSEIALFLERCEAPVLGITGSNGKSTTAALAAALLQAGGARVHFGGNIGKSLLMDLKDIAPEDRVVLELSSFQAKDFARLGVGVQAAVVTNRTPNHLDYHGTFEAYAAAKRQLLDTLPEGGWAVLNLEDPVLAGWTGRWRRAPVPEEVPEVPALPGAHNRMNLRLALAGARALHPGLRVDPVALRGFKALPHRLEWVAEKEGVRFYNDSKATTPEAAITALKAFPAGSVHAIVGGRNKGMDLTPLAEALLARAKAIYLIGEAAGEIGILLEQMGHGPELVVAATLDRAVAEAAMRAKAGEVVLLSPACASYDQFANYEERGEAFRERVAELRPGS